MNLDKLYGRTKTVTLGKQLPAEEQVTVELYPVPLDKMASLTVTEDDSAEEKTKKTKELLACILNTTTEEVGKISSAYLKDLNEEIRQLMGTADDNKPDKKIEELRQRVVKSAERVGNA